MDLSILAEESTSELVLEHLVEKLLEVTPIPLEINILPDRYVLLSQRSIEDTENMDEIDFIPGLGNTRYHNLRKVALPFLPRESGKLMIVTHRPFNYLESYNSHSIFIGFDRYGEFNCGGTVAENNTVLIIGGENKPNGNIAKTALHELIHDILDPVYGTWGRKTEHGSQVQLAHCDNHVGSLRCVMHPVAITTTKTLDQTFLGYCEWHKDRVSYVINVS
ncbi:MAG: hypothetical protein AABX34_00115 [Nanoarchaeota archaeon]